MQRFDEPNGRTDWSLREVDPNATSSLNWMEVSNFAELTIRTACCLPFRASLDCWEYEPLSFVKADVTPCRILGLIVLGRAACLLSDKPTEERKHKR